MSEHFHECSTMQKSADSLESADSLRGNPISPSEIHQYDTKIQGEIQNLDQELEQELKDVSSPFITPDNLNSFIEQNYNGDPNALKISQDFLQEQSLFGIDVTREKLKEKIDSELNKIEEVSTEDRIKAFTESVSNDKSSTEILNLLISEFEHEEAVQTWIENWKKFLRLHEIAQAKSPAERKVITNIIGSADFSSETAFQTSFDSIMSSSEISEQTKLEISVEFDGSAVSSISELDSGLQYMKSRKAEIDSAIDTRNDLKESLDSDIEDLQEELGKLSFDDPKREELEEKILDKKDLIRSVKSELNRLESEKPFDVSYLLRPNFPVILNPNGSRSIRINSESFSLRLPTNSLPFMGTKNMRSVNLAFVCSPLLEKGISKEIFVPNLKNRSIPTKSQRDMGHLILDSLGFNDSQILSEKDVNQVHDDLARLTNSGDLRTGRQCLSDLGIYDPISGRMNIEQFKKALRFIRKNRDMRDEVFFARMEELIK